MTPLRASGLLSSPGKMGLLHEHWGVLVWCLQGLRHAPLSLSHARAGCQHAVRRQLLPERWEVRPGIRLRTVTAHSWLGNPVCLSMQGRYGGWPVSVKLWNVDDTVHLKIPGFGASDKQIIYGFRFQPATHKVCRLGLKRPLQRSTSQHARWSRRLPPPRPHQSPSCTLFPRRLPSVTAKRAGTVWVSLLGMN